MATDQFGNPIPDGPAPGDPGPPVDGPPTDGGTPPPDGGTPPPDGPAPGPKTIGVLFKEKSDTAKAADADAKAAIDADAKAAASKAADLAKEAEISSGLKSIGKPFVEAVEGGMFLIHYSTVKGDGSPGYSSEAGVGADTAVPEAPVGPTT